MSFRSNSQRKIHLREFLETQAEAIHFLSPRVFLCPGGVSLHRLRVALRRMQAAVWLLRQSPRGPHFEKLMRELASLGGALGKVRELDVAIKDAGRYGIGCAGLRTRREKAKDKLRGQLAEPRRRRLAKRIAEALVTVDAFPPQIFGEVRIRLHHKLARTLERKNRSPHDLHRLRIVLKKIRYLLESMGRGTGPLRKMQRILGNFHDLQALQELTGPKLSLAKRQVSLRKNLNLQVPPVMRFALQARPEAGNASV